MPEYNNILQATSVMVCTGCPIDRSYNHTILFSDRQEQYNYFYSLHHIMLTNTLNKQSFQRASRNSIRVEAGQWRLMHSNYLVFINENMGGKYYYAFIDDTVYINPNTTEIFYTIDVMQTWMFDYILKPCFVEREHSVDDVYGENLLPEPVDLGPYYVVADGSGRRVDSRDDFSIVLATTATVYGLGQTAVYKKTNSGNVYAGIPSGCFLYFFDRNHITADYANHGDDPWSLFPDNADSCYPRPSFKNTVDMLVGEYGIDVILGAYIVPTIYANNAYDQTSFIGYTSKSMNPWSASVGSYNFQYALTQFWKDDTVGNEWTPHNKKLFTYPYCYISALTGTGEESKYMFEAFDDPNDNEFMVTGVATPDASTIYVPVDYKGVYQNFEESITISSYPVLSFNVDSFKAWWAQNRGKIASNIVNTAIGAGANNFTGDYMDLQAVRGRMINNTSSSEVARTQKAYKQMETENALKGFASNVATGELQVVADAVIAGAQAGSLANPMVGNQSGSLQYLTGLCTVRVYCKCLIPEYARRVDEFLDMFGYSTKRVKVPNTNSRPYWNYVKTVNCHVEASDPTDNIGLDALTEETINGIYDKGITFWKYRQDMVVCDYSKDNSPT